MPVEGDLYAVLYDKGQVGCARFDGNGYEQVKTVIRFQFDARLLRSRRAVYHNGEIRSGPAHQFHIGQTELLIIIIDDLNGFRDGAGGGEDRIEEQGIRRKSNGCILTGNESIFPAGEYEENRER